MQAIQLHERNGRFLCQTYIPDGDLPSVIIWHDVLFLKTNESRYQECTYFVIPRMEVMK